MKILNDNRSSDREEYAFPIAREASNPKYIDLLKKYLEYRRVYYEPSNIASEKGFYNSLKGHVTKDQAEWVSNVFYRLALDANKDKSRTEGHSIVWLLKASERVSNKTGCLRNYRVSLEYPDDDVHYPWERFSYNPRPIYNTEVDTVDDNQ
jgi:hypothetical protein